MARSTKSEHRTRFKARIVLMAADGAATRAIGRALGCTTGTASNWRVRYAKDRLPGFSEVGDRGAEARYDKETDRRILAVLDAAPPEGYANWTRPLIAKGLATFNVQYVWRFDADKSVGFANRRANCHCRGLLSPHGACRSAAAAMRRSKWKDLIGFDGARRRGDTDRAAPRLSSPSGAGLPSDRERSLAPSHPQAAEAEGAGRDEGPGRGLGHGFVDLETIQTGRRVNPQRGNRDTGEG